MAKPKAAKFLVTLTLTDTEKLVESVVEVKKMMTYALEARGYKISRVSVIQAD